MKVLMVEPGKHPYQLEIEHTLEAMYQVLDCDTITATYPWEDPVALVTDDEGLFKEDHDWNRVVGECSAIRGNFFLCGLDTENFADLPLDLMEKYRSLFWTPEMFLRTPAGLIVIRMDDGTEPG